MKCLQFHLATGCNRRFVTFFFYSWGMRAESFNLRFIQFGTQKSLSSAWCPSINKLSSFCVLTGCCFWSNGNHLSVSNFSKIPFLGPKQKGRKAERHPSTSPTLNTLERLHMVFWLWRHTVQHPQFSGSLETFRQTSSTIHHCLYNQSFIKSDFLCCYTKKLRFIISVL